MKFNSLKGRKTRHDKILGNVMERRGEERRGEERRGEERRGEERRGEERPFPWITDDWKEERTC